jgi:hypothetical protein
MKLSEWEWKYKEWHQKDRILKEICTDVASTISTSLIPLIQNDATAHARLVKLKAHVAPSDPTRRRELRAKYDALRSPKPRNTSVDKWLDDWIRVTDLMTTLKMPEMQYLVGYDSSNIYRVWIPSLDRVIRTRDVIFKRRFSFKDDAANRVTAGEVSEQELETLDLAQPHFTATASDLYTTEQMDRHLKEIDISIASDTLWPNPKPHTRKDHSAIDSTRGTISPYLSPTPKRSPTPEQSPTPERSPSPDNSTIAVIRRLIPSA